MRSTTTLTLIFFKHLNKSFGTETIEKYLSLISKDFDSMRLWVKKPTIQGRRAPSEVFEPSIFVTFPFIRTDEWLICFHPQLFYRSTESFVYDTLGNFDRQSFMNKFGKIFEDYVSQGLQRGNLPFTREQELVKIYGGQGQQIDFFIEFDKQNVLVECKAGAMPVQGMVGHTKQMIASKTKQSVIKALDQANDFINKLPDHKKNKTNYLIVITYKEMYLGNGIQFQKDMATEAVNAIIEKYNVYTVIPLENIYFLTISDFDFLMEMLKDGQLSLVEAIEKAKDSDLDPHKKKFFFSQHLLEWRIGNAPAHLNNEFDAIFQRLTENLNLV